MSDRTPMLSDSDAFNLGQSKASGRFLTMMDIAVNARDFYEALISSGELIRRDELTKLLEACEAVRSVRAPVSDDDDGEWEMQPLLDALDKLDAALDHINAKNP